MIVDYLASRGWQALLGWICVVSFCVIYYSFFWIKPPHFPVVLIEILKFSGILSAVILFINRGKRRLSQYYHLLTDKEQSEIASINRKSIMYLLVLLLIFISALVTRIALSFTGLIYDIIIIFLGTATLIIGCLLYQKKREEITLYKRVNSDS